MAPLPKRPSAGVPRLDEWIRRTGIFITPQERSSARSSRGTDCSRDCCTHPTNGRCHPEEKGVQVFLLGSRSTRACDSNTGPARWRESLRAPCIGVADLARRSCTTAKEGTPASALFLRFRWTRSDAEVIGSCHEEDCAVTHSSHPRESRPMNPLRQVAAAAAQVAAASHLLDLLERSGGEDSRILRVLTYHRIVEPGDGTLYPRLLTTAPPAFPARPDRPFWWARLYRAFASARREEPLRSAAGTLPLETPAARERSFRRVRDRVKELPHREAMELVARVCGALEPSPAEGAVLDWDELRALAREGVALWAHTRHPP